MSAEHNVLLQAERRRSLVKAFLLGLTEQLDYVRALFDQRSTDREPRLIVLICEVEHLCTLLHVFS